MCELSSNKRVTFDKNIGEMIDDLEYTNNSNGERWYNPVALYN